LRTFAISDIHGYNKRFRALLKKIEFRKSDTLFLLGDYIDRGDESKEVLDTIFLLLENGFDIRCIKGNHEQMLLDAPRDSFSQVGWLKNGGDATLKSFLTSDIERIPEKYIRFFKELPNYLEFENHLFVHAGINMLTENPLEDVKSLLWLRNGKLQYDKNWLGERVVVHGHTPMKESFLRSDDNLSSDIVCIDNGIYQNGQKEFGGLCALNVTSKEIIILQV
jgi:serine/threonine protein phosphatase 1